MSYALLVKESVESGVICAVSLDSAGPSGVEEPGTSGAQGATGAAT